MTDKEMYNMVDEYCSKHKCSICEHYRECTEIPYDTLKWYNMIFGTNEDNNSPDLVNHPKHYQLKNGLEVIDVVDAFTEGLEGIDAVDIGNAVKYLGRLGKKDDAVQEVSKARWYLDHYINRHEQEKDND